MIDEFLARQHLARTVMIIQRSICQYRGHSQPLRRAHCDCKYGLPTHSDEAIAEAIRKGTLHHQFGEDSGCPELAAVEDVLNAMTDKEWERLIKRMNKPKRKKNGELL